MDLFNAKALAASESRCAALERELVAIKNDLAMFKQVVRRMDDAIFQISMKTDWSAMQPYVAELVQSMELRRRSESDRISSIINTELFS